MNVRTKCVGKKGQNVRVTKAKKSHDCPCPGIYKKFLKFTYS